MSTKHNIKHTKEIVNDVIKIINTETESISLDFNQIKGIDNDFEITHKEMIARFCESGDEPTGKVKAYIVRNTRMDCGLYLGSIKETSERSGVGKSTVYKVFLALQYDDIIRLYKYGIWAVHPKFLRKGNSGKYLGQLRFYNSLPKKNRPNEVVEKEREEMKKKELEEDSVLGRKFRLIK